MTSDGKAGWRNACLGEIAVDRKYGYTASATDLPTDFKFLRITDIVGDLDWATVPFVEIEADNADKYLLKHGDVVIGRTGANVGIAEQVIDPPSSVFASYLVRFRFDSSQVADRFAGYLLRSPAWKTYVQGAYTGSGQPQLNASLMANFQFLLPPIDEQQKIAWILGSIDDKIDNNRRVAKTLEEIAAALFKARFVDFVDHDDLVESAIGPIPRGWDIAPIGEVLNVVGGGTPSTKEPAFWDGVNRPGFLGDAFHWGLNSARWFASNSTGGISPQAPWSLR